MKHRLTSIAGILLCLASAASAQAVEVRDSRHTNPALLYWQAASMLAGLDDAKALELRNIARGKAGFTPDVLDGLSYGSTERFLHKAAASEAECEWGLAWEDGWEMTVPHVSKILELSTVTLVLAEADFAGGNAPAGIEKLVVAHRMARHLGADSPLIGCVTQLSIERDTIATAARHCMGWKPAERAAYLKRLQELPTLVPLHSAYAAELRMSDQQIAEDPAAIGKLVQEVEGAAFPGTPEQMAQMTAGYRETFGNMVAALRLHGEKRRDAVAAIEQTFEPSGNILIRVLMPSLSGIVAREDETSSMLAMLKTALEYGPAIREEDLAGEPFTLVRENGALELKSGDPGFSLRFGN